MQLSLFYQIQNLANQVLISIFMDMQFLYIAWACSQKEKQAHYDEYEKQMENYCKGFLNWGVISDKDPMEDVEEKVYYSKYGIVVLCSQESISFLQEFFDKYPVPSEIKDYLFYHLSSIFFLPSDTLA